MMEITIKINGRRVSVEVSAEVAECMDAGQRKTENLSHEQRRHWDGREFDEYIIAAEGVCLASPPRRTLFASGKLWIYCCPFWPHVRQFSGIGSCSMRYTATPMMKLESCMAVPNMRFVILLRQSGKFSKIYCRPTPLTAFKWLIK